MELHLEGEPPLIPIQHSAEEISNAHNPYVRFFTVSRDVSVEKEFTGSGEWKECNSLTAAKFSATAYFFGKQLSKELGVPIGLISTSWGGTPVQVWTSEQYLRQAGTFNSMLDLLKSNKDEILNQMSWIKNNPVIDVNQQNPKTKWQNLEFDDEACSKTNYADSKWRVMNLPTLWEKTAVGNFDGVVWFRKTIEIPKQWLHTNLTLELGPIDDVDRTYVNGELVGKTEEEEQWQKPRVYSIPKEIVTDTSLTLAVRVIDYGGGGGLYGDKTQLKMHIPEDEKSNVISLAGEWKYLPVAEYLYGKFYVYGAKDEKYFSRPNTSVEISANTTPTVLYNAMIAPLIPYRIKGVIWYQGEENTHDPKIYRTLFPLMIKNWRTDWNEKDMPFYFVQIAPYDYGDAIQSQVLRESQLLTLSTPHTGMAVTLDIGEENNIHPADKKSVGERLAFWALAKTYGKQIPYSGPLYKSMKIVGDKIVISFDHAGKGLSLREDALGTNLLIAGEDKNFFKAKAKIEGKQLVVYSADVKHPVAVRYAWSNTPNASLFNLEGLPASPFRTDDWGN